MDNYRLNGISMVEFDDVELEELYNWVDSILFIRLKKNIVRDFFDGGKKNKELFWNEFDLFVFNDLKL